MVALLLGGGTAIAAPAGDALPAGPTENHALRAVPAPGPITLDGDLKDWDRSGAIILADDSETARLLVRVSAMYDAAGLYLAFEFKDPTPMVNHVDPKKSPGQCWRGDTVQLRINTGSADEAGLTAPLQFLHVDAYWYSDGKQPGAYVVYGDMRSGGRTTKTLDQAIGQGVDAAFCADADGQGYVQEMRLTWDLLRPGGAPYKAGESLRLAIEAMWDDATGNDKSAERIVDLLNPKRPEREAIWTNPGAWGTLEFVAAGRVVPDPLAAFWPQLIERHAAWQKRVAAKPELAWHPVDRPCLNSSKEVCRLLNTWFAEGTAAGNAGDYYDNRDHNHSPLDLRHYPQLTLLEYVPEQIRTQQDYGLFQGVRTQVTVGNSSTASRAERGGSNPRYAQMNPIGMFLLYAQYRAGNLFVYPGHYDYLPGHSGHGIFGDMYPLNSPYLLISRGSSYTDKPFMNASFHTLAAFQPKVKRLLCEQGLLMPTLQAILRASNRQVVQPEDYFTGNAHPAVFRGEQVDDLKMVRTAHEMTPERIPPLARIRVAAEDPVRPGIDGPEGMPSERFCDTPCVIGRIHRRWARNLCMTVSAADSFDVQDRRLTFRWVLLQGDPQRVKIEPSADGREARLMLAWHDRFPTQPGSDIDSNRVDIGVFASNGQAWSAPAFVCVYYPDNELRTYDEGNRLVDLYAAAGDTTIGYATGSVIAAEGVPNYDIRDWPALLELAATPGDGVVRGLFQASLNDAQRSALLATRSELQARLAKTDPALQPKPASVPAAPPPTTTAKPQRSRRDGDWCSAPLLAADAKLGGVSAKVLLERVLNGWKDAPEFYMRQPAAVDGLVAARAPEVRKRVEAGQQRLVELGIYSAVAGTPGAWQLNSVRSGAVPVTQRLTRYEQLELKRFHLLLLSDVLLPGILAREYTLNYVDYRLATREPDWSVFQYAPNPLEPPVVKRRQTAAPLPPPESIDSP